MGFKKESKEEIFSPEIISAGPRNISHDSAHCKANGLARKTLNFMGSFTGKTLGSICRVTCKSVRAAGFAAGIVTRPFVKHKKITSSTCVTLKETEREAGEVVMELGRNNKVKADMHESPIPGRYEGDIRRLSDRQEETCAREGEKTKEKREDEAALPEVKDTPEEKVLGMLASKELKDKDPEVRLSALGEISPFQGSIPYLIEALKDEESRVVKKAIELLLRRQDPVAISFIAEVLETDPSLSVKMCALRALSRFKEESSLLYLRKALKHEDQDVRKYAAEYLGQRRDALSVHFIEDLMHDPDREVRIYTVRALEFIASNSVIPVLIKALRNEDPEVVKAVPRSLKRLTCESFEDVTSWEKWWQESGDTFEIRKVRNSNDIKRRA